jgi:hypothetical protein
MNEEKLKEWQKVVQEESKLFKQMIKEIQSDGSLSRNEKKIRIQQATKLHHKNFFETRMRFLGH